MKIIDRVTELENKVLKLAEALHLTEERILQVLARYVSPKGRQENNEKIQQLEQGVLKLEAELDREKMKLVACSVVALANTEESLATALDMHDDFKSATLEDVTRSVRDEIKYRKLAAEYKSKLEEIHSWAVCGAITTAEDMMQNLPRIVEITTEVGQ